MANKNVIWCDSATLSKDISGKIYIPIHAPDAERAQTYFRFCAS